MVYFQFSIIIILLFLLIISLGFTISWRKKYKDQFKQLSKLSSKHNDSALVPPRLFVFERLKKAIHNNKKFNKLIAVFYIDLDRFLLINDSMGRINGDSILKKIGLRLKKLNTHENSLDHLNGDEFIFVMSTIQNEHEIIEYALNCLKIISKPMKIDGQELTITCSIGISVYPKDGEKAQTLLDHADIAMHKVKKSGGNSFLFYKKELQDFASLHFKMENDLRQAVNNQALQIYYQPIINLLTNKICAAEALLRWPHPTEGFISPEKFIPIAEQSGLILPIGVFVLEKALIQHKKWELLYNHPFKIAINISTRQLVNTESLQQMLKIINESHVNKHSIELELTESVLLQHDESILQVINDLKQLGVSLVIDDFGKGFSSLSYLQQLPVDKIKIDLLFVRALQAENAHDQKNAEEIILAIIAMAKKLKLITVAEGVEDAKQYDFLKSNHCDQIQGYYISKPIDADNFTNFLMKY
jgi:diguanylate cyclase (GGDEF)-like protein